MVKKILHQGFALPSIMIASVVMLALLATAISSVTTTRTALDDQYYNQLAREAAESGITKARACLQTNAGAVTWSNASPLRPETDCNGDATVSCSTSPLPSGCGVMVSSNITTSFSVGEPTYLDGRVDVISSSATVSLLRTSNKEVWRQFTTVSRMSSDMTLQGGWSINGKIVAGHSHTCAMVNGKIWCWGSNAYGQLGSTGGSASTPRAVYEDSGLAGKEITDISADGHSSGSSAGASCAIASGSVYCWGKNDTGQLGTGDNVNKSLPTPLETSGTPMYGRTVTDIDMGGSSTCAVADNRPYCWGGMDDGAWPNSNVPILADPSNILVGRTITDISVPGRQNSQFCVVASGQLYCRSNSSATGTLVLAAGNLAGKTVTKVSANHGYICAITTEEYLYCGTSVSNLALMGGVLAGKKVTDISVGPFSYSRCAIADGLVYCWGASAELLGNGASYPVSSVPVAVDTSGVLSGASFISVVSEYAHVCVLSNQGVAYCWDRGVNRYGQVGNGSATVQTGVPLEVVNPNPVSSKSGFFF